MSVVIPTHDTRELTLRCLASLGGGGLAGLEVVLVDDGSSDGTGEAVAARHPEVVVVAQRPSRGFAVAANLGLARAHGDLLVLLNSDTEVAPGALGRLAGAFAANPRLGAAGAELRFPDGRPQWGAGRAPTASWLFMLASGLPGLLARVPGYRWLHPLRPHRGGAVDWVTGAAMALRRRAWQEVGPLDEGFGFYCQDLDLCLRLRDAGWEVGVVAGAVVTHHLGGTIRHHPGAVRSHQHPELLWRDLVRWAEKRSGPGAARRAARALWMGATARVAARAAGQWLLPARLRTGWREETRVFAHARGALSR